MTGYTGNNGQQEDGDLHSSLAFCYAVACNDLRSDHTERLRHCRAIKQSMVFRIHVGIYSNEDTMAHTCRLVVNS